MGLQFMKRQSTGGKVRMQLEWTMQYCGADQQRNILPTEFARKAAQAGRQQQPPEALHQVRKQK